MPLQGTGGHHHTIALDDALAHFHHVRVRVGVDVDPGNLSAGQGKKCIACGAEHASERWDGTERLLDPHGVVGLHKYVAGEEPFASLVPRAVDAPHDLAPRHKAFLNDIASHTGDQLDRLRLLPADDLNHVDTHANPYLSARLRPFAFGKPLQPHCSDTYSNPQPPTATRAGRRLPAIGICVINSVAQDCVFGEVPPPERSAGRAHLHAICKTPGMQASRMAAIRTLLWRYHAH